MVTGVGMMTVEVEMMVVGHDGICLVLGGAGGS